MIAVTIPCRTVNPTNSREHWSKRAKRAKHQRELARWLLSAGEWQHPARPAPPCTVTLTRIAPRRMDDDGAIASLKHCRDGVADWLGIDDGSPLVTWNYGQEKGKPKEYAVRVEIA